MINFDNAATTFPKPPAVRKAAADAIMNYGGNAGRGGHELAMRTSEALYSARETVSAMFGAEPENTIFTLNCTYALNMAIQGVMSEGGHLIISSMEHNAVSRPAFALAEKKQIKPAILTHVSAARAVAATGSVNLISSVGAACGTKGAAGRKRNPTINATGICKR